MGYQQPAFMISHPASAIAISDVSARGSTTALSDDSKRALIDSRQGEQASFTAAGSDAGVEFDLLTAPTINRWVIPAGHTMNQISGNWQLYSDDNSSFSSGSLRLNEAISGTGVFDGVVLTTTTERYWLFQALTTTTQTFTLGEFWIGERVAISSGYVQPGFRSEWEHHIAEDVIGGRDIALELTPPRRRFSLEIRYVVPATSDALILEEILRLGRSTPFWYWTPDDTDTGPYLVKLEASATRAQESAAPQAQIAYTVSLTMIEQTT